MAPQSAAEYSRQIKNDLGLAAANGEFNAIICGLDFHASVIGGIAAATLDMPLLVVSAHSAETISLMVPVGQLNPATDKYLYIDDFFCLGDTKDYVFAHKGNANITATYEAQLAKYERIES